MITITLPQLLNSKDDFVVYFPNIEDVKLINHLRFLSGQPVADLTTSPQSVECFNFSKDKLNGHSRLMFYQKKIHEYGPIYKFTHNSLDFKF